ncbi:hypothetical protein BG015_000597, partial [Linnemannia schmuckeri]
MLTAGDDETYREDNKPDEGEEESESEVKEEEDEEEEEGESESSEDEEATWLLHDILNNPDDHIQPPANTRAHQ